VKRFIGIAAAVAGVGILAVCLLVQLVPYGHDHTNPPVKAEPTWPSPEVRVLAQRACFDCHSNQTVWPWYSNVAPVSWLVYGDVAEGRQRVNFSDWTRPQGQYTDEFKEAYDERNMPPASYLSLHPEARLTEAERKRLFDALQIIAASYGH
jgi:hypothetical protein